MDILEKNKEEIKRLSEIYIVSNTPNFLYKKFRADYFVQLIAQNYATSTICNEFIERGKTGVSNIEELVIEYILYIALTLKEYPSVAHFFADEGNINFEWFADIKSIYLSSYLHTNEAMISFNDMTVLQPKIESSSTVELFSNSFEENRETLTF